VLSGMGNVRCAVVRAGVAAVRAGVAVTRAGVGVTRGAGVVVGLAGAGDPDVVAAGLGLPADSNGTTSAAGSGGGTAPVRRLVPADDVAPAGAIGVAAAPADPGACGRTGAGTPALASCIPAATGGRLGSGRVTA